MLNVYPIVPNKLCTPPGTLLLCLFGASRLSK